MSDTHRHCPLCGARLDTGELPEDTAVRCSDCGGSFVVSMMMREAGANGAASLQPNKKAKASLVFGLLSAGVLSLLLLIVWFRLIRPSVMLGVIGSGTSVLFGVLAIAFGAFGIRDARRTDTHAAKGTLAGGMLSGVFFGLLCGGCGVLFSIWLPGIRPMSDPAALAQAQAELGTFTLPEGIRPSETQFLIGTRHLRWEDSGHGTEVNVVLYPKGLAMNESAARTQSSTLRAASISRLPKLSERDRHEITANEKKIEIVEEFGRDESGEYIFYSGYMEHPSGWLYARVLVEPTRKRRKVPKGQAEAPVPIFMTREQVKRFFKSFKPPKK